MQFAVNPKISRPMGSISASIGSLDAMVHVLLIEGLRLNGVAEQDVTILGVGDSAARINSLRIGRISGVMLSGTPMLAALKMGFKELIDFSKIPVEVSVSSILSRRDHVLKNPEAHSSFPEPARK